jgi:hypothetical protein
MSKISFFSEKENFQYSHFFTNLNSDCQFAFLDYKLVLGSMVQNGCFSGPKMQSILITINFIGTSKDFLELTGMGVWRGRTRGVKKKYFILFRENYPFLAL